MESISPIQLNCIQHIVTSIPPGQSSWTGLDTYVADVQRVFERTILNGENQSALLVGSAGNGKRYIVKKALELLGKKTTKIFHSIYLSGSMIYNETEAFREIVQQLSPDGIIGKKSISFFNMYDYLKQLILEKNIKMESILFILDDFDTFVTESKQLLLYNLLDWMQFKNVKIGLLGITCNFNVLGQFEKRIKSRFSNIQIVISSYSFKSILQYLWNTFQLNKKKWPKNIKIINNYYFKKWEYQLHDILFNNSIWKYFYDMGKPLEIYIRLMLNSISLLTIDLPWLTTYHIQQGYEKLYPNHIIHLLQGLTTREMTLVLGMISLENQGIFEYSFEMIFHECKLISRQYSLKFPSRIDFLQDLDNLIDLHVVIEKIHQIQPEYSIVKLMIRSIDILNAIKNKKISCKTFINQWAMNTLQ